MDRDRIRALAVEARDAEPGGWEYQEGTDAYTHIVRAGRRFVCQLAQTHRGEAIARHMAACSPDVILALLAERDALVGALEWYANEANYSDPETGGCPGHSEVPDPSTGIPVWVSDLGARARAALSRQHGETR